MYWIQPWPQQDENRRKIKMNKMKSHSVCSKEMEQMQAKRMIILSFQKDHSRQI